MKSIWNDDNVTIALEGRIDSNNSQSVEAEILEELGKAPVKSVTLDADELDYISSAGLRTVLHLRKRYPDFKIINVKSDVYEVFSMTGFTEMMEISKAYRKVSIEGCEVIGKGANGTIYRIDQDNVVKVYNNADALDEIQHEREVARLALILGIPTAISYDVVRVGDSYGSVFELLNARSFSKILATEPEKLDWCVEEYVEMLRRIHGTEVPAGKLPDMRETVIGWAEFMKDHLPEESYLKLNKLVTDLPHDDHMIHGDYHTKNLELQGDEVLLIDMDTLAVGHPVIELASMYNAYTGFFDLNHEGIKDFQGFDYETAQKFWHKTLATYLRTSDEALIRSVEEKAAVIGYTRLIRRSIRRGGLDDPERKAEIDFWKDKLISLLDKVDSLDFDKVIESIEKSNELELVADENNLREVIEFIDRQLENAGCSMKSQMQIDIAVEEIFINIAKYAYAPNKGMATIRLTVLEDPLRASITFIDRGVPYDPLAKKDPDVTLSAEERPIGGLGIFMVKKSMDDMYYEYRDGCNILTLVKSI